MLFSDPVAQGGLILALVSLGSMAIYKGFPLLQKEIRKRIVTTIDIQSGDELFQIFTTWLAHISYGEKSRLMTVSLGREKHGPGQKQQAEPIFSPGPGKHYFRYKSVFCIVERDRKESSRESSFSIHEDWTITLFTRKRQLAKDMIFDAIAYCRSLENKSTIIYSHTMYGDWVRISEQKQRSLQSVFLKNCQKASLLQDVSDFLTSEAWYRERGIPYRRGYLLYGPAGTGKTSIIKAIAGEYKMNIYIVNMSAKMGEAAFVSLLGSIPQGSILLFEDIDGMYTGRDKSSEDVISFKAFINGIDGVGSPEGILIFMTTNHPEKLDPALIRPGRIDYQVELGHCDHIQLCTMYESFYGTEGRDEFINQLPNLITPAEVQQKLIQLRPGAQAHT